MVDVLGDDDASVMTWLLDEAIVEAAELVATVALVESAVVSVLSTEASEPESDPVDSSTMLLQVYLPGCLKVSTLNRGKRANRPPTARALTEPYTFGPNSSYGTAGGVL